MLFIKIWGKNMDYYEDEGVSLGQIFKVIFNRKILLLIVSLSVAVVFFVSFYLIYNPSVRNYEVGFIYEAPSLSQGKYIDGSVFSYSDVVSLNNLEKVKASNEKYKDIDIEKNH